MTHCKRFLMLYILLICLVPQTGQACTTFSLDHEGRPLVGKNYDWHLERGLVVVNKRGVTKTAMVNEKKHPGPYARWTSKYGSVTFNQYGRELPMGGMNEAGLVVEVMMLLDTTYAEPDSRPAIASLQWIQYQLDNFSKVQEVISSDSRLRILPGGPGVHYLVADKEGNCASIEILDGKQVYHTRKTMPVKALTNSTYTDSLHYLKEHKGFGGKLDITKGEHSLTRFVMAAFMLKAYDSQPQKPPIDYAFSILVEVAQESKMWGTKWSIVYDIENLRVYFRTFSNQQIRYMDLSALNFSCREPVKVLDMNVHLSGNVGVNFHNYTQEINLELIRHSFRGTSFLSGTPDDVLEKLSKYPETTSCVE